MICLPLEPVLFLKSYDPLNKFFFQPYTNKKKQNPFEDYFFLSLIVRLRHGRSVKKIPLVDCRCEICVACLLWQTERLGRR